MSTNTVTISQAEYSHLKKVETQGFESVLLRLAHARDIAEARGQASVGAVTSQAKLFKKLGLKK
jgi:hypothetical protein